MRGLILIAACWLCASCGEAAHNHIRGQRARIREAKELIHERCAACHQVPGIAGANGRVGPSLAQIWRQQIIAGHFANTPTDMSNWIEHPQRLLPGDAMPEMGLSHEQVSKIVDYLYTMD